MEINHFWIYILEIKIDYNNWNNFNIYEDKSEIFKKKFKYFNKKEKKGLKTLKLLYFANKLKTVIQIFW